MMVATIGCVMVLAATGIVRAAVTVTNVQVSPECTTSTITVTFNSSDAGNGEVDFYGPIAPWRTFSVAAGTNSKVFDVSGFPSGYYRVRLIVGDWDTDGVGFFFKGAQAPTVTNVQVSPDFTTSAITVTFDADNASGSGVVSAEVDIYAHQIQKWYNFDAVEGSNSLVVNVSNAPDGYYRVRLLVFDSCGNAWDTDGVGYFTLDRKAPKVTLIKPQDGDVLPSSTIPVEGTVTDNLSTITFVETVIMGNDLSVESDGSFEGIAIQPKKEITLRVSATDEAGNVGTAEVDLIKVHDMRK